MVQVDVFWTFAIGSSFAAAAAKPLARTERPLESRYFTYTLLFLSVLFAPSGVCLLWAFPGWETMFMLDRDVHALVPCLFASTNIVFGVLGFLWAWRWIRAGRARDVHKLWLAGYAGMLSILGLGFRRFLYAGTSAEWKAGLEYPLSAFFSSPVFFTLLAMAVVLLPAMLYPYLVWPREARAAEPESVAHGGLAAAGRAR